MTMTSTTRSSPDLRASVELVEIKPGVKFSLASLRALLPDVETLLFFGKVYELDYRQLSSLMSQVLKSDLAAELFSGDHSVDLQDYLVGEYDDQGNWHDGIVSGRMNTGDVCFSPDVPKGEILPEVWKSMQVEVAKSIKDVAAKLESVVGMLPGKQGQMVFGSMMKLNAKRPVIGDYKASIHHVRQQRNLLILDVSGSMSEHTVRTILPDVVAMAYTANADLAIVSNTCTYWVAGTYDVDTVVQRAEFGGTQYEQLADLLQQDWGVVITVADYDSSLSAKDALRQNCSGHIDEVLDISLVNRPTFLAECVGQFADKVTPLLVGNSQYVVS